MISIFHDVFPRCFHGLLNCKARSWQVTQRKLWARPFSVSSAINSSPFFLLLLGFASYDVIRVFVRFSRRLRISREENTNLNWGFKCHRCWWHLNTVSSMRERGRRGVPTMGAWESSTKLTNPRRKKQAPWSKKMRSSYRTTLSVFFLDFRQCIFVLLSLMIVGHHFDHLGSKVADLEKTQSSILNNPLKDMPEEVQTWMRTSWSLNWEVSRESVTVQGQKNPCHVDLISSCSVVLWGFIGKSQVLRLCRSLSSVRILMHRKIRFVKFKKPSWLEAIETSRQHTGGTGNKVSETVSKRKLWKCILACPDSPKLTLLQRGRLGEWLWELAVVETRCWKDELMEGFSCTRQPCSDFPRFTQLIFSPVCLCQCPGAARSQTARIHSAYGRIFSCKDKDRSLLFSKSRGLRFRWKVSNKDLFKTKAHHVFSQWTIIKRW